MIGVIVFRKRIAGVFVSIITLALVLLVRLVVIDAQPITNGFNGLVAAGTNDILARAVVFGVVIMIIILKPKGLFSLKGR